MAKPLCKDEFISILRDCKKKKNLAYTKLVYEQIREAGLDADRAVGNHLVPALVECGSLSDAQEAFSKLVQPNSFSWTHLIHGYVENGDCQHALDLFWKMQAVHVQPSAFTFLVLVKACVQLVSLKSGRRIHFEIVKHEFERDLYISNSLLDMYAKCGSLDEAHKLFDGLHEKDVVSWTALIAGYVDHGLERKALICFDKMQLENVQPNAITYFYSVKACVNIGAIDKGRKMYSEMVKDEFERDLLSAGMLIELYAKWGSIEEAREVFNALPIKNTVLWTALIAGYTDQGLCIEAFNCLQQMGAAHVPLDAVTLVCALKACSNLGTLGKGLELHVDIVKEGFDKNLMLGSILMDMYAKCGLLTETKKVFDELPVRDVVAWTTLMSSYAYQGEYDLVLHYFERMREEGIEPSATTFLIMFTVCNHAGLVSRGLCHFQAMIKYFDITPSIKHQNAMVDLLGRAGQLNEASSFLNNMPFQPNIVSWETVMGSCRKWGDIVLARHAYESAERLDNNHTGVLVLMSNIYTDTLEFMK